LASPEIVSPPEPTSQIGALTDAAKAALGLGVPTFGLLDDLTDGDRTSRLDFAERLGGINSAILIANDRLLRDEAL
jgi:hypothetical protein